MARVPQTYKDATLAIRYNRITGSNLSHLDVAELGIFERDQMVLLVNYFEDSLETDHAA